MSTFGGLMDIYRFVSIDQFEKENLSSSAYFLSHCHQDHMRGLGSRELQERLKKQEKNIQFYMSKLTRDLLIIDQRYNFLEPFIVVLAIGECNNLKVEHDGVTTQLGVTLISAGHCPGSVMFLFDGAEGRCLYTGDFRLPKGSCSRIKCLSGRRSLIDHMYVDTTFCVGNANFLPSRESSLKALIELISDWISQNERVVELVVSAKYGYEFVMDSLHTHFGTKIFCADRENYKCLSVYSLLTSERSSTQIHMSYKWQTKHNGSTNKQVRKILLSSMFFQLSALPEDVKLKIDDNKYRVLFSFHSSLSEVADFVTEVDPRHVHASVVPKGETLQDTEQRLKKICQITTTEHPAQLEHEYKPLGKLCHRSLTSNGDTSERGGGNSATCTAIRMKRKLIRRRMSSSDDEEDEKPICSFRKMKKNS